MSEYEKWANEVLREACERRESFRISARVSTRDSLAFREGRTISMFKSGQKRVRELRAEIGARWPDCPPMDAWAFLVTEVGELGDVLLRLGYGKRSDYVRNNEMQPDLEAELGDVFLMLCTLATAVSIDLEGALTEVIYHLRRKHGIVEPK